MERMNELQFPLKGNVALVTGAAIRVGKAIAKDLASCGADIALHYNTSQEEALETAEEIESLYPVKVLLIQGDLAEPSTPNHIFKAVYAHFGRIDILINSASIFNRTPYETLSEADFNEHINVNLRAPYLLGKLCGDLMLEQRSGHIINISDWCAGRTHKNYLPYLLSKAGLDSLTRGLAVELAPYVQVNSVAPGAVLLKDNIADEDRNVLIAKTPLKRIGTAEDVARAVRFLVCNAPFITGAIIPVDGGRLAN